MAFEWHISALPAFISALFSWTLAVIVYRTRPDRLQNKLLAGFLATAGAGWFIHKGLTPLSGDPLFALAAAATFLVVHHLAHTFHLLFITTLDTSIVKPLANAPARLVIGAIGLALAGSVVFIPAYFNGVAASSIWPGWWAIPGPAYASIAPFYVALFLLGVIVAVGAYVQSSTKKEKDQNRAYLLAFAVHDGGMAAILLTIALAGHRLPPTFIEHLFHWVPPLVNIWMVSWLTIGILRTQLFDIELKVRRGVSIGTALTLVAVLPAALREAAVFSDIPVLSNLLTTAAFVIMVGVLLLLRPAIDRALARPAPMPDVDARKLEVYRSALDEAGDDEASQRVLQSLRAQLGLSDRDHALLTHSPARHEPMAPGSLFLSRFRIERSLGRGGQAECFLAEDQDLGRRVVLKAFPTGQVGRSESRALARLRHPNVVSLHDVLRVGESTYLVMEYMHGGSLRERGGMDEETWHRLCIDVISGLDALHRAGLIHGDIKPGNVLLRSDGSAALADLGTVIDTSATMPATATSAGTLQYLSPERARGGPAGVADDLWALAATLYEARSAKPLVKVWDADQPHDVRRRVAAYEKAPSDAPPWLREALSKEESVRPRSASELLEMASRRSAKSAVRSTPEVPCRSTSLINP